ncbi:MAG TPA: protein kinase, partial [Polyangiales bacterium]|nr:protein kinase [Polyangiales bacterium]
MKDSKAVQRDQLAQTFEPVEAGVDCELKTRGRYQICMELASGGMGTVYLALYRGVDGFERVVALKRMHPELAQQAHFVEMFFDEAQALARVQHPNVCALLDLGTLDDSYFLAMDYLEGEP